MVDVAHGPSLGEAGRLGGARKGRGPGWWVGMARHSSLAFPSEQ